MNIIALRLLAVAAMSAALAVALGAFGAHALRTMLDDRAIGWWHTATEYHLWHSLAMAITALVLDRVADYRRRLGYPSETHERAERLLLIAACLFVIGTLLFSGSLYLMAMTDITRLGVITPFGGICLIGAWLCLVLAITRLPQP